VKQKRTAEFAKFDRTMHDFMKVRTVDINAQLDAENASKGKRELHRDGHDLKVCSSFELSMTAMSPLRLPAMFQFGISPATPVIFALHSH
jgi:hypothetical protein